MERLDLDEKEQKLYATFKKIQEHYAPNLKHISPLDIPALLSETALHPEESHEWFRQYHYTLKSLINESIANDRTDKEKIIKYVQKSLTQNKEFVIRLMMMSAAVASPESPQKSLFNILFGNVTGLGYGVNNNNYTTRYDEGMKDILPNIYPLSMVVYGLESSLVETKTTVQPTDNGVCAIINGDPKGVFDSSTEDITLFKVISEIFDQDNLTVTKAGGAGLVNGFALHLMGPRNLATEGQGLQSRRFQVSFNQNSDFFSNLANGFILNPGFRTMVTITPTMHVTTDDFRELSIEERKCRYTNELPDNWSLFKNYTQKSCQFLCMIECLNEHGDCVPWDHIPYSENVTICDGLNAHKFATEAMRYNPYTDEKCQCLPDCESVTFSSEVSTVSLDEDILCTMASHVETAGVPVGNVASFTKITNIRDIIHESIRRRRFYDLIKAGKSASRMGNMRNLFDDTDGFEQHCREHLGKEHAILIVMMRDPDMLQIVKSTKFTFADRLGIAGGTIGLCTGLSLISIVEVAYWMIVWVVEHAKKYRQNRIVGSQGHLFGIM